MASKRSSDEPSECNSFFQSSKRMGQVATFNSSLRTARRKGFENARVSLIEDANMKAVENEIFDGYEYNAIYNNNGSLEFSNEISSDESSDKGDDYECNASCNNDISFEFDDVNSSDESSDKEDDIGMTSKCFDINQKLLNFYLRYNLTRNAMEALLKLLNIHYDKSLPLSVITLKAKSGTYNQSKNWVKRIEGKSSMSYIGVKDNLLYEPL
ncbi:uncharacterized protein LOC136093411 [Hydra vulgaris]|uniref:uncharacterized protein LOC136093411 n=1 Tax=Hydra vulgaris TaxID=6087 RepID=UPI0032EA76C8